MIMDNLCILSYRTYTNVYTRNTRKELRDFITRTLIKELPIMSYVRFTGLYPMLFYM